MKPRSSTATTSATQNPKKTTPNIDSSNSAGNVKVVCRFRPANQKELAMGEFSCCEFLDEQTVIIKNKEHETNPDKTKYYFDRVFPMNTEQEKVYEFAAKPVISSVLEGFNGTVFAYGQTSSGKTHTMQGPSIDDPRLKGIIPRMVTTVFEAIENSPDHIEFRLKVSLVEIYMEKIRDLLDIAKTDLKIREDKNRGIYIQDVTEQYVSEETEIYNLMRIGNSNRAISATQMNEGSSRSHSLFMLTVSQNNLNDLSAKTGKLFLVDLAGSEKIGKTGASGQTLDEAKKINKSLSSLGNVINSLTDGKSSHIPYRDSKLTRILQESLGGNARTTLIITCSPSPYNEAETISTLRFGVRAKSIKNKPKINRELTVAELQILLAKAEKIIVDKDLRIKQLEEYIKNLGNSVPEETSNVIIEKEEDEAKEDETKEENDYSNTEESKIESPLEPPLPIIDNHSIEKDSPDDIQGILEKNKSLENELELERNNVKAQTEKLNNLRKEFTLLNAKSLTQEKENESLIHKLAEMTMSLQSNEEILKEKDDKIDQIESLKLAFISEIEGLKESKEHLLQVIEEKNKEIEMKTELNSYSHGEGNYSMKKSMTHIMMEREKSEVLGTNISSGLVSELEKAIAVEKENTLRNYKKYEEMKENYEKICAEKIPDFDSMRKNLMEIIKEEIKNVDEKTIEIELNSKIAELIKTNNELDNEREKNTILENYLIQTKKTLRKKINIFENNIELITNSYHQLISQRSVLKLDNQALEKQMLRKNERITQLEKLLSEAKEQYTIQRSKYDGLKAMVHQSELGNHVYVAGIEMGSPLKSKTIDMRENPYANLIEEEKGEITPKNGNEEQIKNEMRGPSNPNKKIVKHIRGGQAKLSLSFNPLVNKVVTSNNCD